MRCTAKQAVALMQTWIGADKRKIIDIYNDHKPLAQNYIVLYNDAWCDTTISALFITLGCPEIIGGTECGVERHIQLFKKAGIWIEDGTITPETGYIICYNWDDSTQPNDGCADHIGLVEEVKGKVITVIEGNYNDAVKRRYIPVGWGYIRGYALPQYEKEEKTMSKPSGIDVSGWQPKDILLNVPYDFVGVKITQGTGYINPYWRSQVTAAINKGKPVLAYHYANGSGVNGEVNFFLQTLGNYIKDVIPALDWETSGDSSGKNSQFGNPKYAKQWLDEVKKRTKKNSFIYGSKDSCFNTMDWKAVADAGYKCWGAQYANNNPVYGYSNNPWQSAKPWGAWGKDVAIHQYTSNLILPGYGGRLDGNISYMALEQLKEMAKGGIVSDIVPPSDSENLDKASLLDLVARTWNDEFGKNEERKRKLGDRYDEVQSFINHIVTAPAEQLAKEVWTGKYGNNDLRKKVLNFRYPEVQAEVDKLAHGLKPVSEVAKEVIAGKWGNDPERTKRLRAAGYDSVAVQKEVNRLLGVR